MYYLSLTGFLFLRLCDSALIDILFSSVAIAFAGQKNFAELTWCALIPEAGGKKPNGKRKRGQTTTNTQGPEMGCQARRGPLIRLLVLLPFSLFFFSVLRYFDLLRISALSCYCL